MSRVEMSLKNVVAMAIGLLVAMAVLEVALAPLTPPPLRYRSPQPLHMTDPELGWTLKPNQHSFTIDQLVTTNGLGLRSPEIAVRKPAGVFRVLCLGDSQTFGNGVTQDRTYAAMLRPLLAPTPGSRLVESINGGVQGYDTLQEVALLERLAPQIEPDVVTLGFYLNDIGDVLRTNKTSMAAETGEFRRDGLKRLIPYPVIYLAKRSRLITLVLWRLNLLAYGGPSDPGNQVLRGADPPQYEPAWRLIEESLSKARDLAISLGFRLIVFPVPALPGVINPSPSERYRSRFLTIAARLGIDRCDPTPAFLEAGGDPKRFFIPWDGHLSTEGHEIIARSLARAILAGRPAGGGRPS